LGHLEWMPTRLDETRWKMCALPMGMVRQTANLLAKDEARRVGASLRPYLEQYAS
jgi:hypothetical protein